MAYEITGTIKKIFDTQTFSSGFFKREFVVTTEDRFPQDIKLDCLKEKAEQLEKFKEGERVKVSFDIRGREYNGRYFTDLSAWKIEPHSESGTPASSPEKGADDFTPEDTTDYSDEDNIPF